MDVLIIHYNTQELTEAAIQSLWKHTSEARVTIFDNSDKRPFDNSQLSALGSRLSIIDNTRGQVVNWEKWLSQFPGKEPTNNNWASAKHCYSVELCLERFPDGFLLMDSDVLVKQDVSGLFDRTQVVVAEVGRSSHPKRGGLMRFMPMLCYMNIPMLQEAGVHFFNPGKMWALTERQPDCWYDTGAWLLEAVREASLPYRNIVMSEYVEHFGHGSWKNKQNPTEWLELYSGLWK